MTAASTLDRFMLESQPSASGSTGELSLAARPARRGGPAHRGRPGAGRPDGGARLGRDRERPGRRAEKARRRRQRHPARDLRRRWARRPRGFGRDGGALRPTANDPRGRPTWSLSIRWTARRTSTSTARSARSSRSAAGATGRSATCSAPVTSRSPPDTSSSARRSSSSTRAATASSSSRSTRRVGEFLLARSGLRMPERGEAYAVNEGRAHGGLRACASSSSG